MLTMKNSSEKTEVVLVTNTPAQFQKKNQTNKKKEQGEFFGRSI